jgi:carboxymethylenebutenolidase
MWNDFKTYDYSAMEAKVIDLEVNGEKINAYFSRPVGKENVPGIVLIPHMPGWDEWCRETARRFTEHGYQVVCPNIYYRYGDGTPVEVSTRCREAGMVPDKSVMADTHASAEFLKSQPDSNRKVGVIGMCSGGRHAFMAACELDDFDAAIDCWGGSVFGERTDEEGNTYTAADHVEDLNCPLFGIFGNDDKFPTPEEVVKQEELLDKYGKDYEFVKYDGAGHGIWYYDKPMYRQEAAMDSFNKALDFFDKHLK